MTSKLVEELLECVRTIGEIDQEAIWLEHLPPTKYHAETDGPILHVKKSVVADPDDLKSCLENKNLKALPVGDEWHIFKPRN